MKILRTGFTIFAALFALQAVAQVQPSDITSLPAASTVTGAESIPGVQSDAFVKFAPADLSAYVQSQLTAETVISKFSGVCDDSTFLRGDGVCSTPTDTGVVQTAGTFTASFTGCTVNQNLTFSYVKTGQVVTLMPQSIISCTSNANNLSAASGSLPAALRPARIVTFAAVVITNNGVDTPNGCFRVDSTGSITVGTMTPPVTCNATGFTAGGVKRFGTGGGGDTAAFTYPLN